MKVLLKTVIMTVIIMQLIILSASANETFYNWTDIEKYIYNQMEDREVEINFKYKGPRDNFNDNIQKSLKDVYSKDDYLERSWIEINPKVSYTTNEVDTKLDVKYLSTKEQEDYVNNELSKVTQSLINDNMSDLQKVEVINNYIINRFEYDYTLKSVSAYSALMTSKTVCQGYAMTAYKMFNDAQIESRIVVGNAKGISHSWNCVKVNGNWYHIDITNNDSINKNKYFLLGDNTFIQKGYVWDRLKYPVCLSDYND